MRIFLFILLLCCAETSLSKKRQQEWTGTASFYANKFNGRKTASGEIFSNKAMTAANNFLPLGTWVKVTNLRNKKSIRVRINDRLHPRNKRLIDLTRAGAQKLGFVAQGTCKVKVELTREGKEEVVEEQEREQE